MKILADFHIHSKFSDGKLAIPEIVDLYGSKGFGAIAITDHLCEERSVLGKVAHHFNQTLTRANFPLYSEILKSEAVRAWEQYKMVLIPGFEITKNTVNNDRSAHFIGLGLNEYVSADGDVIDIAKKIKNAGGLVIAAHPVSTQRFEKQTYHLWSRREELRNYFDAWEVASGKILFQTVLDSGLPMIANSDLHHPKQLSSWKTALHCERHPEAILNCIKKQQIDFQYYECESEVPIYDSSKDHRPYDLAPGLWSDDMGDMAFG